MFELSSKAELAKQAFRQLNNQVSESLNNNQKKLKRGFQHINKSERGNLQCKTNLYEKYKAKPVHKYSSRDILYYFKDLTKASGIRFVSNTSLDKRYMRNINQLLKDYDIQEILDMYDFLFKSNQTYIKKEVIHPGILLTAWGNKIFDDSRLYKKGQYVDNKKLDKREYVGDIEECAINDWGE